MPVPRYDEGVFINCPFDEAYAPLFQALVFAVHDCGFLARCALEAADSGEVRIAKILRIIRECRIGIHDISRTEADAASGLPRFNMPLELGLFLGAREFGAGAQRGKRCVILDTERYRYQKFCSDIAGQDIRSHGGDPQRAMGAVRDLLATVRDGQGLLPGMRTMCERYAIFQAELPALCRRVHLDADDLRFVELRTLVEEWVEQNPPVGVVYVQRV